MSRVLLLGGTSESRWISKMLLTQSMEVVGSVTTPSARGLFVPGVKKVFVGNFTDKSLEEFIKTNAVETVLDATHPFAVKISKTAMRVCRGIGIFYVRYERPRFQGDFSFVPSLESVAEVWSKRPGNALVATGAKKVQPFLRPELQGRVFFRLLKTEFGRTAVKQVGLAREQIWWDDPNPSAASVREFLSAHQIRCAVIKDSGPQGIALTLAEICPAMGIRLYVLQRPKIQYPLICSSPQELEGIFAERLSEKVR